MSLSVVNFAARCFGLTAFLMLGLTVAAQQAIQFSKPVDSDPAGKANAFMPEKSHSSASSFNAPSPFFGDPDPSASFDILPGSPPPPPISSAYAAQLQKSLDDKKNWALMTPEEILGVSTPEKILGIPDPNDDPRLSREERYLQRQDRQYAIAASNAWHSAGVSRWRNSESDEALFHNGDPDTRFAGNLAGSVPGATRNAGSLFGQEQADAKPQAISAWTSPFVSPDAIPKTTPEQLAGMDRFRALMESPARPPPAPGLFVQPAATPDPNMQPAPAFNPAGRSFKALENDIAKPLGLTPLPGVTGPPAPPKKVSPPVQPPPWMQDPLQNGSLPQRQF